MRLLITRPEPDGERTAAVLRGRGHEVLLAPMLHVELVTDTKIGAGPWVAILITSANGARAVALHPRRRELTTLPVLAVGDASAVAARNAGFTDVASAGGDGADLARIAAARFGGNARPLLYLSGEERARDLSGDLAAARVKVETAVVYRTVKATAFPPPARAAIEAGAVDGVLHFSRRSVEAYLDCASAVPKALEPAHFCLSSRAAEPLLSAGAAQVVVANRPDEAALLELVTTRP